MAIALVASDSMGFGVTSAGVVYNFPSGAPGATDLDILCVNSDAAINVPSGWTLGHQEVNNQGSYIFYRKGGAGASVTVSSVQAPGPFNATLTWSRWTGTNTIDVNAGAQATGGGNTSPAVSTGVLAAAGELVYTFSALHATQTSNQNTPVWSAGFTNLQLAIQGSGGSGCVGISGYKLNAGTPAETPSVTWSGDAVTDRYVLVVTFTAAAVADTIVPDGISLTTSLGAPALTDTAMTVDPTSITLPVTLGAPTVAGPPQPTLFDPLAELYTQALGCLCAITNSMPGAPQHCGPRIGPEVAYDLGQFTDFCCEGLAYISLGDTWISDNSFPDQDIIRQVRGNCPPGFWAQDLKLGIVRCSPVGSPDGEPPTDADWAAAAVQNLYDAQALRRVACCIRNFVIDNQAFYMGMSVVINRQVQTTPNGGCVERYVTVTVQFPNVDCVC
jgi:hypothetical protein